MSSEQTFDPSQFPRGQFPANRFSASQVPKYPVYQLFYEDLTDDERQAADPGVEDRASRVELDGIRVEPAAGQPLREAAIAAIAKKASDQRRSAVRVVVTTGEVGATSEAGQQRFKMIVTAEGETIDLSDTETTQTKRARKKTPIVVGGLILAAAATTTAVTAVVLHSNDQAAEGTHTEDAVAEDTGSDNTGSESTGVDGEAGADPGWEAPNAGAQVPVGLPEEYSATAAWVRPVAEDSGVLELSDDTLAMIDPEGTLQVIDPESAQPLWYATDAPDSMEDVHETTWAGEPVLAEADSQSLRIWPIPQDLAGGSVPTEQPAPAERPVPTDEPVQPESIELTHQAEVSFVGDSPLVDLGDYVVAADAGDGTLTEVEVPAGAEPLFVADGDVVSIDDTHLYHSPISAADTTTNNDEGSDEDNNGGSDSVELSHHSGVTNDRPQALWALTGEVSVGLYEGEDEEPLIQVFTTEGERMTSSYLDTASTGLAPGERTQAQVDAGAQTAVIGSVGIQWGDEPAITSLTPPGDPLLHETTLWGSGVSGADTDGPARTDITQADAEPQPYEVFSDEDPAPVLVTDQAAYLEAPRVDQTLLYRAEHQPSPQTNPHNDETNNDEASSDEEQDGAS